MSWGKRIILTSNILQAVAGDDDLDNDADIESDDDDNDDDGDGDDNGEHAEL